MNKILSWASILLSIAITCFWAFWGIIENFHEGWYYESFFQNIGLMFLQYLSPMIIAMVLSLIAIRNHKIGALIYLVSGAIFSYLVNNLTLSVPFIMIGLLFWFSKISAKKWKYRLSIILPLITLIIAGAEPIYRVSGRVNDGDFSMKLIQGNEIGLVWAPDGPGWPKDGMSWFDADSVCRYLNKDGLSLAHEPQNIWRLPSIEEATRTMNRHGKNCGGVLNENRETIYEIKPDKETPLWNPYSKVIYWWTSTEIDDKQAYIIVYDGKIWKRNKKFNPNYLGFRAVKEAE
jgi:hypothetical protein